MLKVAIYLLAVGLFFLWNITFQWGIVFMFFQSFLQAIVILFYITFLALSLKLVGAVLFGVFLTEGTFFFFSNMFISFNNSLSDKGGNIILIVFQKIFYYIYLILPISKPFSKQTDSIFSSLKYQPGDIKYLFISFIYTIVICSFLYLASTYLLKRKRLI